jgi:hypothetical protein
MTDAESRWNVATFVAAGRQQTGCGHIIDRADLLHVVDLGDAVTSLCEDCWHDVGRRRSLLTSEP